MESNIRSEMYWAFSRVKGKKKKNKKQNTCRKIIFVSNGCPDETSQAVGHLLAHLPWEQNGPV